MTSDLLHEYYKENNVPKFHGSIILDALKHLSELTILPSLVQRYYQEEYDKHIYELGSRDNYQISKLLYKKFNDEPIIKSETPIHTYTVKDITVSSYEIEIPYFRKMNEYIKTHLTFV